VSNTKPPIIPCVHLSLLFPHLLFYLIILHGIIATFMRTQVFFFFFFFFFFTRCNTSRISAEKIEKNSLSSTVLLVVQLYYFGLYSSIFYISDSCVILPSPDSKYSSTDRWLLGQNLWILVVFLTFWRLCGVSLLCHGVSGEFPAGL
jgi:hypothetical protein